MDVLPCFVAVTQAAAGRVYTNRTLAGFCQVNAADPLQALAAAGRLYRPDRTLFPGDDLPDRAAAISGAGQTNVEIAVRRPDGSERLTIWDAVCLDMAEGRVGIATGRDITDERELAQSRQDWLSAASHDLRSPTTTVLLALQLAQRKLSALEKAPTLEVLAETRRQLELAEAKTRSLVGRMDLLLSAAAADAGQVHDASTDIPIHLGDLAAQAVREFEKLTNRHALVVRRPPGRVIATGNETRLRQVLSNLIENAIKYSPDGGSIEIEARAVQTDEAIRLGMPDTISSGTWALVEVRDQGIGIRPEDVPHVFDRFRRGGGPAAAIRGTGLGLYMSRVIVEAHGGHIWVAGDSQGGEAKHRGATVRFALPITRDVPAVAEHVQKETVMRHSGERRP
ncbi:MAG: HAMP domain-containing histidine kinase [Chloroflexi bacterium]|nr:HAMP domain-containing histidine kinase [Chloroflexota bacterium]